MFKIRYDYKIKGDVFIVEELYGADPMNTSKGLRHPIDVIGETIQKIQRRFNRKVLPGAGDLNIFQKDPNNNNRTLNSFLKKYNAQFVPAHKGHNSRIPGWALIANMLYNATLDTNNREPGLWFVSSCEHMIRTLLEIPVDPNNPEDVLTKNVEDHLPDALRYLLTWLTKKRMLITDVNINNAMGQFNSNARHFNI